VVKRVTCLMLIAVSVTALALTGCSDEPTSGVLGYGGSQFSPRYQSTENGTPPLQEQENSTVAQARQFAVIKRLAVSYAFTLRLPSNEVEAIQKRHLAECAKLGCTVLNTHLNRSIEGRISARSSVRISPESYPDFAATVTAAPAELASHSESTEDKTLAMLDIEKRLEVKMALRDRLSAMLKDPGAKSPADLAAIEKELAQVQGDIEATIAQRDYLRTITETVRVDINYSGQQALVRGLDFSPVSFAVAHIGQTVVSSVAALVLFLAALVPWLPLIALVWWAVRRSFRRWRAAKAPA
jgi:hypothetical protein